MFATIWSFLVTNDTNSHQLLNGASGQQPIKKAAADAEPRTRAAEVVIQMRLAQRAQPAAAAPGMVQHKVHAVVCQVATQNSSKGRWRQCLSRRSTSFEHTSCGCGHKALC